MKVVKYSFIVPVYNREDTIRACLDSILNQTLQDFEIVIVDDGSTDSSGQIADEYASNYQSVKVIHKPNGGLSSARNAGMEEAKGEYLLFPDSDDECKITLLEEVDKFYGKDLIVFGYDTVYSKVVEEKRIIKEDISSDYYSVKDCLITIENAGAFNVAWNKAYKKELIGGLLFENLMPAEDLVFNCNYYKKVKSVAVLFKTLYCYNRKEDVSLATKYNPKLAQIVVRANEERRGLFLALGICDEQGEVLLAKKAVGYAFSIVPNIFRKGNGLKRKQKYLQLKEIIKDKNLKKQVKLAKRKDFNGRLFSFHIRVGRVSLAYFNYSILFFIRNNMTKIYKKLRRK